MTVTMGPIMTMGPVRLRMPVRPPPGGRTGMPPGQHPLPFPPQAPPPP